MSLEDTHGRQLEMMDNLSNRMLDIETQAVRMLGNLVAAPIHMATGFAHHAGQRAFNAVVEKARSLSPFRRRSIPDHAAPLFLNMEHGEVGTLNVFPPHLHVGPQEPDQHYIGTPRIEEAGEEEDEYYYYYYYYYY